MSHLWTVEDKNNKEYVPEQVDALEMSAGGFKNRTFIYLTGKTDTSPRTCKEQSKLSKLSTLSELHLPYSKNNNRKHLKLLNNRCP